MSKVCNILAIGLCCVLLCICSRIEAQYCTPVYLQGCIAGGGINDFKITGEAGTSIMDVGTGCSTAPGTPPLVSYLDHSSMAVSLYANTSYPIEVSSSASSAPVDVQLFADFNNNFSFTDPDESIGGGTIPSGSPAFITFTTPALSPGTYRLRAVTSADYTYPSISPCPTYSASGPAMYLVGEAHDYSVHIVNSSACSSPGGLLMSFISATSGQFSWDPVPGALGYEWAVTTSATPPVSGTYTTVTSVIAAGLSPSTTYHAYVRTKCSATDFSPWVSTIFATLAPPCPYVSGLLISGVSAHSATLNWATSVGAVSYEWVVTTSTSTPSSGTSTTLTSVTATGLIAATTYQVYVRALCPISITSWSMTAFTTPAAPPCPVVTGLTASAITTSSAVVAWSASGTGSMGYQYVIDNMAAAPSGSGINTTSTSVTATGLTPATAYFAHVRDSCGVGDFSAWTTISFATLPPFCDVPTFPYVSSVTSSDAVIIWTDAIGAVSAQYVVNTTLADPTTPGTVTTAATLTASGLLPATSYYAHVRDSCISTALSSWIAIPFTTLAGAASIPGQNYSHTISVSPNPARSGILVTINEAMVGTATLSIIALDGKVVCTRKVTGDSEYMDVSVLPTGVYSLRYTDDAQTQVLRIVLE